MCLAGVSYGQQLITDESVELNPGIYRDFYEFKYNKPSIKLDDPTDSPEEPNYSYKINLNKENRKAIGHIYGYCNGMDVYLPSPVSTFNPEGFSKVSYLGRYSIYWFAITRTVSLPVPAETFLSVPIPVGTNDEVVFVDMNTGEKQGLYRKWVESKIKDDPEIYKRYLADERSLENRVVYLIEYLAKHPEEIQVNKDDLTSGDINEILLVRPSDASPLDYCNRIMADLSQCTGIKQIEISESKYSKGNYKYIGLRARHYYGFSPDYEYRIGNWRYYNRDGTLKEEIDYDLIGRDRSTYEDLIIHY
jgi:hypothetical protein